MTRGLSLKRMNASVSASFILPAIAMVVLYRPSTVTWLVSLILGLVWANWFEYFYHRWMDHTPGLYFERKHRRHHAHPENEDYTNLGDNPLTTFGMFAVNWTGVLMADLFLKVGFSGPVLFAFVFYVLLVEEAHFRAHHGGYIPESWKAYHLSHHKRPKGRYNICFPIFDWVLRTM